jgi:hypothetical protein
MSIRKTERNQEIVKLINLGINYQDVSNIIRISKSRVEVINKAYNKDKKDYEHCVRCGETKNLVIPNKVRNICKNCLNELRNK